MKRLPHRRYRHHLSRLLILGLVITATLMAGSLSETFATALPGITDEINVATSQPDAVLTPNTPVRKQILNDEAKGLSGFFIIGIAVNIIMALSFAWWFTREWRRPRK